jgi:hypothetical protein
VSADELRKAAETLRERAGNASTGDGPTLSHEWFSDLTYMSKRYEVVSVNEGSIIASNLDRRTAEIIATMHPGVGLALADWLDDAAAWEGVPRAVNHDIRAHDIARLINGGAA